MANKGPTSFDFATWLDDNNLQFSRKDEQGTTYVRTPDGQEKAFDVPALMADLGADPTKVKDIRYNIPETAVADGTVSFGDRAKLSLGNPKGQLNYLKNKYGEAQYVPDLGLVVNDKGVWKKVDPGAADAWEMTKAIVSDVAKGGAKNAAKLAAGAAFGLPGLVAGVMSGDNKKLKNDISGLAGEVAKDVADLGTVAVDAAAATAGAAIGTVGAGVGAVGGTAVAPGPGTIIGAGALGAGAGAWAASYARTELGRLAGTYEATPMEQLRDVSLDTVMALAGQAALPGTKPTLQGLANTGKEISRGASDSTKSMIAGVYGQMTGVGTEAMQALMQMPTRLTGRIQSIIKKAGPGATPDNAIAVARRESIGILEKTLEAGVDALPQKYGELLETLFAKAETSSLRINPAQLADDAMRALEAAGLGRIVPKVSKAGSRFRTKMINSGREGLEAPSASIKDGTARFEFFKPEEIAERTLQQLPAELVDDASKKMMQPLIDTMMGFGRGGNRELTGKAAAKVLTDMNKILNSQSKVAYKMKDAPALQRLVSVTTEGFEQGVTRAFDNAKLSKEYGALSELYATYANSVNRMRNVVKNEGAETLLNQLGKAADKNLKPKGDVEAIVQLLGKRGEDAWDNLILNETASKFLPVMPKFGPGSAGGLSLVGGAGVVAAKLGMAKSLLAVPIAATQFSPRAVGWQAGKLAQAGNAVMNSRAAEKALVYTRKMKEFVKTRTPEELKTLLENDALMATFVRTGYEAYTQEDQMSEQLLQQGGVVGSQPQ